MNSFLARNKGFIIAIVATFILIFGGVALFSKGGSSQAMSGTVINSNILIPQEPEETSGIVNGQYLPPSTSATVTLVEFGDYECPACGFYQTFVKKLLTDEAGKINYVFRNYPLSQHTNAPLASYAAIAAGLQGKLWEMHEKLYSTQNDWSNSGDPKSIFVSYARELGLNVDQFTKDLDSSQVKNVVSKDVADGNLVRLTETPTFYLNGQKIENLPSDYNSFKELVTKALNPK
jgi:protein-disulfide isomerase